MNERDRIRTYSVCEQAQSILRQLLMSVEPGARLERATLSEVRDLDTRIAFVMGELEFLKRDTGFDPSAGADHLEELDSPSESAATFSCREAPTLPAPPPDGAISKSAETT